MNPPTSLSLFGVILAGGSGTRFWPLSRSQYPKQVLRLLDSESLIQSTIERLLPLIPPERLVVVTNAAQADIVRLELFRKGWNDIRIWAEPQGRNTAAAVGLAAVLLEPEGDPILAVFPADHFIRDRDCLLEALERGAALAQEGYLVTFGVIPTRPDTGYGYIKAGDVLKAPGQGFSAARFVEKPDLAQAEAILEEGGYYWNSGIFMFRRTVLLEAFARHLPELHGALSPLGQEAMPHSLEEIYQRLPSISLDHGILERAANVAVVPVDMGWSDVGTWGAIYDLFAKDERGNVILGRAVDLDSRDSLIFSQNRLVATIGLKDAIIVDTEDATLVCHRDRVQDVKELVAELNRQNLVESVLHPTVERPWGRYTVMGAGPGYQVKRIVVDPGKRLSLQLHRHRAEHWVVVQGAPRVTIGPETKLLASNESVFVPPNTPHRLENPGPEPAKIIEVQTGSYLGEDDIVRLADDFCRHPQ